jgi:sugar O-acyltransferase (sialic acid O-acetyltransferase NeuD family)
MSKVLIFGLKDSSSLAHFYLKHDSEHEVVGFVVSRDYMPEEDTFEGLKVYPWESLETHFPPTKDGSPKLFAPLFYSDMNRFRERVYLEGKGRGYDFISYVSSKATVWPEAEIGENCFILEDNTIQPYTSIGNNCILWSGNHIGHHGRIRDNVYFTSHVVMSGHCDIGSYSFLGVNSCIRDGTTIAEGSLIAMGAVVTKNTKPWGVYMGAPAKRTKELE